MDTADVLIKARKILSDPRRWGKGRYQRTEVDGTQCYCALGAIAAAVNDGNGEPLALVSREQHAAFDTAVQAVAQAIDPAIYWRSPSTVYTFNDAPDTKYEDVMEKFSTAVQKAVVDRQVAA